MVAERRKARLPTALRSPPPDGKTADVLPVHAVGATGGTASPKDEADFDEAIDRGIVPGELRAAFADETDQVLDELAEKSPPFAPASVSFRPDPDWPYPLHARRSRDCKGVLGVIESL